MKSRADILRAKRIKLGLSQRQMAELACVAHRTYARYESGQRAMPQAVVELLKIKLDMIL